MKDSVKQRKQKNRQTASFNQLDKNLMFGHHNVNKDNICFQNSLTTRSIKCRTLQPLYATA